MSRCKKRTTPDGIWTKSNMIGAKVRVSSVPMAAFTQLHDAGRLCTISDIYFRTTLDGKTTTVILLEEFPDSFFTWKDLEVVNVVDNELNNK